jgi:precorrin-6B methylase 2
MDRLEEEDPAFREALRKALSEESVPLTKDELRALVLDD